MTGESTIIRIDYIRSTVQAWDIAQGFIMMACLGRCLGIISFLADGSVRRGRNHP
jgi:hypothetical protein